MRSSLLALAAGVVACASSLEAADAKSRWRIEVDAQIVSIPMVEALELIPQLRHPATQGAGLERVQQLLLSGKADLLAQQIVHSLDGEKAVSESITEIRYPGEFDPPELAEAAGTGRHRLPSLADFEPVLTPPTAFETRDAGANFSIIAEVEPNGRLLHLSLESHFTRLESIEPAIGARTEAWTISTVPQPCFGVQRVKTSCSVVNDGHLLAGSFVRPMPHRDVVLFLLHAVAKPQAPAAP